VLLGEAPAEQATARRQGQRAARIRARRRDALQGARARGGRRASSTSARKAQRRISAAKFAEDADKERGGSWSARRGGRAKSELATRRLPTTAPWPRAPRGPTRSSAQERAEARAFCARARDGQGRDGARKRAETSDQRHPRDGPVPRGRFAAGQELDAARPRESGRNGTAQAARGLRAKPMRSSAWTPKPRIARTRPRAAEAEAARAARDGRTSEGRYARPPGAIAPACGSVGGRRTGMIGSSDPARGPPE